MNILQFLIDIRSRDNGVIAQVTRLQNRLDEADRSARNLSATVGGSLRTAFMSLPGAEFFMNPVVAMTAGIGTVSKLGMEAGKTAVSFDVLLGSQEKSADMLGEMNRYAADSPYSRLGVQDAAKTMLGFGVAQDQVMSSLRMLGDIAMGDSERFKGLALVFSQVAAAGKLQGQDLLQLISNGYNPLNDISKLTGKSMSELKDDMSEGRITFEMMRQAMTAATSEGGKFYQMNDRIARTPFGRFGQLADQSLDTLLSLYKVIEPLLIPAFDMLSGILSGLEPVIGAAASGVGWLVQKFKEGNPLVIGAAAAVGAYSLATFVSTSVLKGWTVAQWLQVTAMIAAEKAQKLLNAAMWKNPVGWITLAIGALVAAVVYCWNKFAGFRAFIYTAWDTVKGFGSAIKDYLVDRFWELVDGIGAAGKALGRLVKGDFKGALEEANTASRKLLGFDSTRRMAESGAKVLSQTGGWYEQHLKREESKQQAKEASLSEPQAAAGVLESHSAGDGSQKEKNGGGGGKAEAITAGGTRNTQITVNIQKFFDNINVTMMDRTDTAELSRRILECLNRSVEIAMSAAR